MKNTRFLLLLVTLFLFQLQANAQDARVSLNLKQTTVKQVLKEIEVLTNYTFFYNDEEIDINRKVDISVENEQISVILAKILPTVNYKIDKRKIMLTPGSNNQAATQNQQSARTVSGTIVDENGDPIIGATVRIEGSSTGTITDLNGNYSIRIPVNSKLSFQYIGYQTQTITYKGEREINIKLKEDAKQLDEVVVVGYGVQKKVNLSGSVETVSTKSILDRGVSNLGQALQGTVGNLNITPKSGQANSAPDINIRGVTSITENSDGKFVVQSGSPLIIIDGITSGTAALNNINSADIESISVIKDASAAAIYGSRAAFGVILVTTKKGKGERVQVNYNNNISMRKLTDKQDLIKDPLTIMEMKNLFGAPWNQSYDENAIEYAKKRAEDPSLSPYFIDPQGNWNYVGFTDWFKEAYKDTGFSTNHSLDVSGTTDVLSYYFSANYYKQDGMLNYGNDKYNRYNIRSKLDFTVTKWWKIGNNISYSTNDYNQPSYLGDDFYWDVVRNQAVGSPVNPDGTWSRSGAEVMGRLQDGGRKKTLNSTFTTQFTTQIDIIKDIWQVNGSFALNRADNRNEAAFFPTAFRNGPDQPIAYVNPVSSAEEQSTHSDNLIFDIYTNFNMKFKDKHAVSAVVGFNQEEYKYRSFWASRKELISTSNPSVQLGTGEKDVWAKRYSYALRGVLYRLNYIYKDKYIVETNGRYDGSSRFPKDDRFAFNPSASAAWIVSQEKFFQPLTDVISHFKLRASYGNLGNQATDSYYPYIPAMSSAKPNYILDGEKQLTLTPPRLVSGYLTWETVSTLDFGVDINFFNNRLTTSGSIYRRDTKDMLTPGKTQPGVLGANPPRENAADLRTTGWELSIGWRDKFNLKGKPFNYNLHLTVSDNQSKITKYDNPTGSLYDYYVGQKIGEIWGLHTLGYFTSEEDIRNHADQTTVTAYPGTFPLAPGDLKFEDRDNNEKIDWGQWTVEDPGDFYVIGNTTPRYHFGFTGSFDWNNFDFNIFLQGVGKRDYYPGTSDLFFWGVYAQPWTNVTKGNMDYWTEETPNAYFPRRKAYSAFEGWKELGANQTKYLQNAAYMRLKNLTIGYTLPQHLVRKANLTRLRIFFTGENLAEISKLHKYYKVDPEGLGGQLYPLQRTYSFGLNVSF